MLLCFLVTVVRQAGKQADRHTPLSYAVDQPSGI